MWVRCRLAAASPRPAYRTRAIGRPDDRRLPERRLAPYRWPEVRRCACRSARCPNLVARVDGRAEPLQAKEDCAEENVARDLVAVEGQPDHVAAGEPGPGVRIQLARRPDAERGRGIEDEPAAEYCRQRRRQPRSTPYRTPEQDDRRPGARHPAHPWA